jgi:hypothetical protein
MASSDSVSGMTSVYLWTMCFGTIVADAISEFRWQGWATDDHPVSPRARSPRPRSSLLTGATCF